jgi:hypothetical protein
VEQEHHNPIPFLILAAVVGLLLGSWWIGLLVGIGMTIVPGLPLVALFVQSLLLRALLGLFMVLGFPFFLIWGGIRRAAGRSGPGEQG